VATQVTKPAKTKAKKAAKGTKSAVLVKSTKKSAKAAKPKKPAKAAPVAKAPITQPKLPKKPTKGAPSRQLLAAAGTTDTPDTVEPLRKAAGASATPQIAAPLAGDTVPAGVDLQVDVDTNRGDLGYIVELLDVTPSPVAALAMQTSVAAPAGNNFSVTFPASRLAPDRQYRLRVFVDPAFGGTPPHQDHVIDINT
jgi:hypothetical protein